jgi:hypothetical protein
MGDLIIAAHVHTDPTQNLGSEFPRFRSPSGDLFTGPLFQIVLNNGRNAPGEPLPRLLVNFVWAFIRACLVWRDKDLIFWANNRGRVRRIAENYVEDRLEGKHFWTKHKRYDLTGIVLHCECCTEDGPCWLCEYNCHSLAFLFRAERQRIRERRNVALVVANSKLKQELVFYIAEYVTGVPDDNGDPLARFARRTLELIAFVQCSRFAPEIANIISRTQLNTWVSGVFEKRLRPFWQPQRVDGRIPGGLEIWPYSAYLLRAYPVYRLHLSWNCTINIKLRVPVFFARSDYYSPPTGAVILESREFNSDYWTAVTAGSLYLGFENYVFEYANSDNSDNSDIDE